MTLDIEQLQAVTTCASDVMVAAGPGSGKTRVIISRIVDRIENGIPPRNICVITFTNKAAAEIVRRLKDTGVTGIGFAGTIHALGLQIIRRNFGDAGFFSSQIGVIGQAEAEGVVMEILERMDLDRADASEVLEPQPETSLRRLGPAIKEWQDWERFNGMVHYSSMIRLATDLLEQKVILPWKHFLIDEYQDVTLAEHRMIDLLDGTKFAAGDTDQAIFQWRGAAPEIFVERLRRTGEGLDRIILHRNYRSFSEIIDLADRFIMPNQMRLAVTHEGVKGEGGILWHIAKYETPEDQLGAFADLARPLVDQGESVAVLARLNSDVRLIRETFGAMGLTGSSEGAVALPKDWPKVMALANWRANPNDWTAEQILRATGQPINLEVINTSRRSGHPLAEALEDLPAIVPSVEAGLSDEARALRQKLIEEAGTDDPSEIVLALGVDDQPTDAPVTLFVGTIHSSKGMEFDHVLIYGMGDHSINPRQIEELRRLYYVAITRARTSCWIGHVTDNQLADEVRNLR